MKSIDLITAIDVLEQDLFNPDNLEYLQFLLMEICYTALWLQRTDPKSRVGDAVLHVQIRHFLSYAEVWEFSRK